MLKALCDAPRSQRFSRRTHQLSLDDEAMKTERGT